MATSNIVTITSVTPTTIVGTTGLLTNSSTSTILDASSTYGNKYVYITNLTITKDKSHDLDTKCTFDVYIQDTTGLLSFYLLKEGNVSGGWPTSAPSDDQQAGYSLAVITEETPIVLDNDMGSKILLSVDMSQNSWDVEYFWTMSYLIIDG